MCGGSALFLRDLGLDTSQSVFVETPFALSVLRVGALYRVQLVSSVNGIIYRAKRDDDSPAFADEVANTVSVKPTLQMAPRCLSGDTFQSVLGDEPQIAVHFLSPMFRINSMLSRLSRQAAGESVANNAVSIDFLSEHGGQGDNFDRVVINWWCISSLGRMSEESAADEIQ
jgi:hypothetical protein